MGVYLSSPIRDKVSDDDDVQTLRYGASSMQGWRTSQEDAHNCCTDFDPDTDTTLFACYDGHGGAEVAQYTAQHFPAYLKASALYKEDNLSKALEEGFLGFDGALKEDAVVQKLKELAGVDDDEDETEQKEESNALFEEATMPLEELLSRYGRGGAKAAALIKKEQQTFQSPALAAKKENGNVASARPANDDVKMKLENELMNGHSDNENNENIERASNLGQRQSAASSTQAASTTSPLAALRSLTSSSSSSSSSSQANEAQAKEETDSSSAPQRREAEGSGCDSTTPDTTTATAASKEAKAAPTPKSDSGSDVTIAKSDSSSSSPPPAAEAVVETAASCSADSNNAEPSVQPSTEKSNGTDSQPSSTTTSSSTREEPGSSSASSSSTGAAGSPAVSAGSSSVSAGSSSTQSVAPESSSSSSGGSGGGSEGSSSSAGGSSEDTGPCSSSKQEPEAGSSTGRTRSKGKNVIPAEGEDESSFDEDSSAEDEDEEGDEPWADGSDDSSDEEDDGAHLPGEEEEEEEDEDDEDQTTSSTEEPGSDSGCTSVVALLRGRELFVANAGDSRCVLCRAGKAFDMSVDHKPEDEVEHSRITKAGGRVTMDGRVNGGLNLSRAIGDHCYKRNTELSDREQMITALPDIRSTVLEKDDQFMVLACDGIWNVMTSQDVVNFVSERLKAGVTKLSSICEEMFEFCLSPDTSGDGTGCDNMTCIIVCFKQEKISNSGAAVKRQAESEVPESTDKTDLPDAKRARTDNEAS